MRLPASVLPLALLPMLAAPVLAQEPKVTVRGPSPAVVRLGDQAQIDISIEGEARVGGITLPRVDGVTMQAYGPSREEQSYFDGRTMTRSLKTTWSIAVLPQREGKFAIPAIEVLIDGKPRRTQALTVEAVRDVQGDKYGFLKVDVKKTRVYVHEPLRVVFDYGIDATLSPLRVRTADDKVAIDIELSAPWLDAPDGAVVIESNKKLADGFEAIGLVGNRKLLQVGYQSNFERQGRRFHHFVLERDYLPSRTGKWKLDGPMLRFQVSSGRNQRGRFDGFFEETSGTNYFVYAQPTEVEVLPIPEAGRPADYLGAVGRFTIAAKCDQTKVKLGSPLRVTFTISGDGNLEFLGVPALDDLAGLHLLGKKEQRTAAAVIVTYDLRVTSPAVKEIPAIAYSWFDTTPAVEKFVSAKTAALPLEVVPLQPGEGLAAAPGTEAKPVTPGVDDIFDIKSTSDGPPVVLAPAPGPLVAALVLLAPWLLCAGIAFAGRRLAAHRADRKGARARAARKRAVGAMQRGDAHAALVGYLADRLDLTEAAVIAPDLANVLRSAGVPEALAARAAKLVEAGVAARYGGGGGVAGTDVGAVLDELEVVDLAGPSARRVGPVAGLVLAVLVSGASAPKAQESEAVAAYRAGEYAKAASAFAALAAAPDADRRVHYDLGNALFREGRLAEALLAYERARLAMPRDPELAQNLALVRKRLDLVTQEGESFATALVRLRDGFTPRERFWITFGLGALAAAAVVLGGRRRWVRMLGFGLAVPFLVLVVDLVLLAPGRPPGGIVLAKNAALVSEPRAGLVPLAQLRSGVRVEVLGRFPGWTKIAVGGKSGYLPEAEIGVIE